MDIVAAPQDAAFVEEVRLRLAARGRLDERHVVFVLSPESVSRSDCLEALRDAVAANRGVVPVLRRDVAAAEMPAELAPYRPIAFREQDGFARGLDELVSRLGADLRFDAFVSYSRKDSGHVDELVAGLWRAGKSCWVDRSKLLGSEQWSKALLAGIEASDHFVFVMTPDSVRSKFCEMELRHAVASNKRILPVSLRKVDGDAVPTILGERHWVEFGVEPVVTALNVDPEWQRAHTDLLRRAHAWAQGNRDSGALLRSQELVAAEAWLTEAGQRQERNPTPLQTELILESRQAATRRLRLLVGSVSTALIVTVALAALAVYFWRAQVAQTQRALENAAEAHVEEALGRGAENEALAWALNVPATLANANRVARALATGAAYTLIAATDDRHRGAMAWSAAGTRFAFGQSDGTLVVWRLDDGSSVTLGRPMEAPHAWIPMRLGFSPDGRVLAAYDHAGVVTLWDVAAARRTATLEDARYNEPRSLLWVGSRLAVGGEGRACLYAADGSSPRLLRCRSFGDQSEIAWSDDARVMLWVSRRGEAAIWYPETDAWVPIEGLRAMVGAFARGGGPDGYHLAVGTWDQRLETYVVGARGAERQAASAALDKRRVAGELAIRDEEALGDDGRIFWDRIQQVAWCPERRCVAYRLGGTVGLWTPDGENVLLDGDDAEAMAWSPDGTRLARISANAVRLAAPPGSYRDQRQRVFHGDDPSLAWDPSGRWLAMVAERAPLELWDTRSTAAHMLQEPVPYPQGISSKTVWFGDIAVSPDGRWVAAGGSGDRVGIWAADGSSRDLLAGAGSFAPPVAWSPVAPTLAYASSNGDLLLRDAGGAASRRIAGAGRPAWQIAWSPDGHRIAWGAPDRLAIATTDRGEAMVVKGASQVAAIAWSPNGTRLATVNANGVIDVRDPTGALIARLGSPGEDRRRLLAWPREDTLMAFFDDGAFPRLDVWNPVTGGHWQANEVWGAAAWSTSGELAVGDLDGVRFFTASGKPARDELPVLYSEPNKRVQALSWSPDGRKIAFNGDRGSVVVVDVVTRERCTLTGHLDDVTSIAWDPQSEWLVSTSADGTVRRWPALWLEKPLRAALQDRSNWFVGEDLTARPTPFAGLPQRGRASRP